MGLYLNMQGISQEAQDVCRLLGVSKHSKSIQERKKIISNQHAKKIQIIIEQKLKVGKTVNFIHTRFNEQIQKKELSKLHIIEIIIILEKLREHFFL